MHARARASLGSTNFTFSDRSREGRGRIHARTARLDCHGGFSMQLYFHRCARRVHRIAVLSRPRCLCTRAPEPRTFIYFYFIPGLPVLPVSTPPSRFSFATVLFFFFRFFGSPHFFSSRTTHFPVPAGFRCFSGFN